ncbi:prolyl oligopeptidase family serine peptidase [Mucilaginibacter sp. CAU 1740]|uniref:carboxylesterase family protein n=1 Tax=Mucilaginibacter sp. CAU 1740 TaxID=3140365 RepID=UPI00325BA0E5
MKKYLSLLLLLVSFHFAKSQDFNLYKKALFINGADTLRYRILYPENYDPKKSYPLVAFLHGAGERGKDNEQQLDLGADLFLKDSVRKKYPAIVIFPQCPKDSLWNKFPAPKPDTTVAYNRGMNKLALSTPEKLVKLLMDSLVKNKVADKKRVYIAGLSMGGFGTYDLIVHYPKYFAAAISICGQTNVQLYPKKALHLPLWIFHGADDNVIDPNPNRELIKVLQANGAKNAKYNEYPGVMHNSWINAFAEPDLLPWLFSFKR